MSLQEIGAFLRQALDVRIVEVGGTTITGASVVTFLVIVLLTFWISRIVQRVATRILTRGGLSQEATLATSRRLLHYAVLMVGFAVALQAIGVSLATVFAAGAVAAVAIGFALQNILQNFVSGLILLGERSITETDILEVEGKVVRIVRMGARATVARTRDDEEIIMPNSILVQSSVKNLTLTDPVYRIRTRVGVSYSSDMRRVEEVLTAAAGEVEGRNIERDPVVFLLEFGDSSVVWEVSIWAADPWLGPQIRSQLNKDVWHALQDAGITIAFPQLDVHFDPGVAAGRAGEP
ncbi:MAG: mechanosensitive ion channel [Longimicrobiales bacterium]|nr:mechanosensitive ion channel [Longimicrobiales bacterium]